MKRATPGTIATFNQKMILEHVRKNGPISRADICRDLGMSFPAVSANVGQLIKSGYLFESGVGNNATGRKSTLISFNSERGYVLGVDIGRFKISMILVNLCGEVLSLIGTTPGHNSATNIAGQLSQSLDRMLTESMVDKKHILCVGVGVPGIYNEKTGMINFAPFIDGLSIDDFKGAIWDKVGDVPVLVENSVNLGAIGEKWKGVGREYRNILYINYGIGVGAALVLDGKLYRGTNGASGETAFMIPGREFLRDSFEDEGVLERLVSGYRIDGRLKERGDTRILKSVFEQYQHGDCDITKLIESCIDYIGIMMVNSITVVNPEIVIISGGIGIGMYDIAIDRWNAMLKAHVPFPPEVVVSKLHNEANVLGAAAISFRYINETALFSKAENDLLTEDKYPFAQNN